MAFNPFHGFRKHQKTLFAVMVIVCMFVFILQFGAGDVFTRMLNWFGGGKGKGQLVATLNGTKVYEVELSKLKRERQMASFLIAVAAYDASRGSTSQFSRAQLLVSQSSYQGQLPLGSLPLFGPIHRTEDLLDFIIWRHEADRLGITLTEADVRNVIENLVEKKVFGGKPFTSSILTRDVLSATRKNNQIIDADDLLKTVTDEFRVALAQQSILGRGPGAIGSLSQYSRIFRDLRDPRAPKMDDQLAASTPAITPAEFLQYYREQRATMNVWLMPVSVDDFVAQAKKNKPEPSEEVLKVLFDSYKGQEPSPTRDRPAFKELARVKAEWVSASPDLPYFKEQALLRVELPEAYTKLGARNAVSASICAQVGFGATLITAPGAASPWLALSTAPRYFERTLPKYAEYAARQRDVITSIDGKRNLHDRSFTHPSQLGRIVGAFSASASTSLGGGSLGSAAVAWGEAAGISEAEEEQRQRNVIQLTMLGQLVCPAQNGGVVPALFAAAYRSPIDDYWDVRDRLLKDLKDDELSNPNSGVITTEMTAFSKELAKVKGKQEEADKLIKEAVKKYGLRHSAMTRTLDKYQLEKDDKFDPEVDKDDSLKKLREAFLEIRNGAKPDEFSRFFLQELTGTYEPKEVRRLNGDTYLGWRTEFVPAREPKSLNEVGVRAKVKEAWYVQEARNLARVKAEEWSAEAKKMKSSRSPADIIKFLREKGNNQGVELNGVARLISTSALAEPAKSYRLFSDDSSTEFKKIPLARTNLADQLAKQLKEKGDATVVSDQPERVFYVAVLINRDDQRDLAGFVDVFTKTPDRDRLWDSNLMAMKRSEHEKSVIKQLRLEAGASLREDGDYDIPADIRLGSSTPGGDDQ